MHPKTNALAATLVGSLLVSSVAAAQSADANRNTNNNIRNGTPQQGYQQQPVQHQNHQAQNNVGVRNTGPTCPPGCRPELTREQRRAAARRSREAAERRRMEQEQSIQQARADQQREDQGLIDNQRTRAEQCEHDLASARDRISREDAERAERERLERERQAALQAQPVEPPVAVRRGGGPGGFRSHVYFGAEGGVMGFVGPLHNQVYAGPAWGAHVGWSVTPWFGLEGRYLGSFNDGYNPAVGDGPGYLGTAGSGVARFRVPNRYVTPYIFGGLGVVHYSVTGTNDQQTSILRNRTLAYAPSGLGLEFNVGNHWAITAEGSYNWLIGGNDTNPAHATRTVDLDYGFYTATAGIKTLW